MTFGWSHLSPLPSWKNPLKPPEALIDSFLRALKIGTMTKYPTEETSGRKDLGGSWFLGISVLHGRKHLTMEMALAVVVIGETEASSYCDHEDSGP